MSESCHMTSIQTFMSCGRVCMYSWMSSEAGSTHSGSSLVKMIHLRWYSTAVPVSDTKNTVYPLYGFRYYGYESYT